MLTCDDVPVRRVTFFGETIKQTANTQVALTAWNQATHIYFNHLTTTYNIVAFESKLHLPE